jgi:predicted HTH transcriptional regulator
MIHDPPKLLEKLLAQDDENAWLEFKQNNFEAESVGKHISSLANSAIFENRDHGYLVFGVTDERAVVGTTVRLAKEKVGNDGFLFWLNKGLFPHVNVEHCAFDVEGKHIEILIVDPGYQQPVKFKQVAYIRVDSSLQPLGNYPERERAIWAITNRYAFEQAVAKAHLSADELLDQFDVRALLKGLSSPKEAKGVVIEHMIMEGLIRDNNQGGFDVTNLLAIAAANDLRTFPGLEKKGARLIVFKGTSKVDSLFDLDGQRGYATTFKTLIRYIMERSHHREEMLHGIRQVIYDIPEIAIREIVANALIHQDFTVPGPGPVIEIFRDRIKVTNPDTPLIEPDRFVDSPSKSRNPTLNGLMRRLGLCEQRGSGIDRALDAIEEAGLPAPIIQTISGSTVITLFGPKSFADMTREERIWGCYMHACLMFERNTPMSNASLRARFKLNDKQYAQCSQVIGDAREEGRIKPLDANQGNRVARYLPYWG